MSLKNLKIVNLVHKDFEDLELWYPVLRLREEGITVHLAGEEPGKVYKGKNGLTAEADMSFSELDPESYHGLLVPGGWAPDKLRRYREVIDFVKAMNKQNKPIGEICHAGWVLISADILQGRMVTSTPGIMDDMKNAGAQWSDEPVIIDKNLVSSRKPVDLPIYMIKYIDLLKRTYGDS
jgi:protease I